MNKNGLLKEAKLRIYEEKCSVSTIKKTYIPWPACSSPKHGINIYPPPLNKRSSKFLPPPSPKYGLTFFDPQSIPQLMKALQSHTLADITELLKLNNLVLYISRKV